MNNNINFLKQVLMSTDDYWVVAKQTHNNTHARFEQGKDCIIFIGIPIDVPRGLSYEEITLAMIEKFDKMYMGQNIYLSDNTPPFQHYIDFSDVYSGFPIPKAISSKEFLKKALEINSNSLYDYKKILEEYEIKNENEK